MDAVGTPKTIKIRPSAMLCMIYAFAFAYGAYAATRCVRMDQAIAYLGGLRILDGQILYHDFALPHGPVSVLVMAQLINKAPTGGWAVVIGSGILNLAVSYIIGTMVLRASLSQVYAAIGSMLTAIWFVPVYGWIYIDHLAYAFVLASALPLCKSNKTMRGLAGSALMGVCAFHTKLSIALPGLLAVIVSLQIANGTRWMHDRKIAAWLIMLLIILGLSLVFIRINYQWSEYLTANYYNPVEYWLNADSPKRATNLIANLILPFGINPFTMIVDLGCGRLLFYPIVMMIYASYLQMFCQRINQDARFALCILLTTTVFCGALIGRNHTHLFFGCGGIIALTLWAHQRIHKLSKIFVILWVGFSGVIFAAVESPFFPKKVSARLSQSDLYSGPQFSDSLLS
jgi:hypothetical protein